MRPLGPNHIWSVVWDDRLEQYGISIYAVIDMWSRKILGMYAHPIPGDPIHVGINFLNLAAASGGVPITIVTNDATGTMDLARYQIELTQIYGPTPLDQYSTQQHFTAAASTYRIDSFWSRLRTEYHGHAINSIRNQIEQGKYNPENHIHRHVNPSCTLRANALANRLALQAPVYVHLATIVSNSFRPMGIQPQRAQITGQLWDVIGHSPKCLLDPSNISSHESNYPDTNQ
ncbi:hypothetical protein Pst134EA_024244 [Puccinia striiformis f. sp. tritici]|uniref:hypothetical protein n=1 Tax=Puccinia striiformis f. sp. tritici TaxID=168172 RepID=UPI002007F083|nr:hypothetical protein Pst134EA_024244 [Puccinia striiformis f. sp. tritici]KAH9453367.1 hypothetical protein Pst134EA_024244 [Puccinia striiformis f. sp. tritici]